MKNNMVLNNDDLNNLESLIFSRCSKKEFDKCFNCSEEYPKKCKYLNLCNRYNDILFYSGGKQVVRDLFDTINSLRQEINNK
jgi:hypothetical protein